MNAVVFGEVNEEVASRNRNVNFTYSGGDVKLIYKRNNLHIKQLVALYRFFIFLCLRTNTKLFYDMDSLAPIVLYFFIFSYYYQ
ncbi:hypothetical protein DL528_16555 [Escherichia coli]|nr:hypothetical protein [Escherichia coli]EGD9197736.1 hypothetical protein [Escherichia coli]EGE2607942.1 hypothetical protein [Escherichia coli]EGE3831820.1 hypothetical protein [Escherichia coli]PPV45231.1 hypothetical protein C5O87_14560 [Escherichia coli]